MRTYTSPPLELPADALDRADLIFYEVDHSGPSYTARIFLDNPAADVTTATEKEQGYAGCFTIFGHAGCVGTDDDHCNPLARSVDEFDWRPPHPLLPQTKTVTITDALRRLGPVTTVTVTVVAVEPGESVAESSDALAFASVRLAAYVHDQEPGDGIEKDLTQ